MCSVSFFLAFVLLFSVACLSSSDVNDNVKDACGVTRYRDLCIHSLAAFSNSAKRSPYNWARAAISVTLAEAKATQIYLSRLDRSGTMRGREGITLSDCVECFLNAVDELHDSLSELRRLQRRTFDAQMGNVVTWTSSALTDADTCLEGFSGSMARRRAWSLTSRVTNVTYYTSNALALVNKLVLAGGAGLNIP